MTRGRGSLLALVMCGCASASSGRSTEATAGTRASTAAPTRSVQSRIPLQIGNFKLTQRTAVRGTLTDSLYRFSDGSGTNLSVIVYDVIAEAKTDQDPQKWTAIEGEKFKEVQEIRKNRGDMAAYSVAFSDSARFKAGSLNLLEHRIATPVRYANGTIAIDMQYLYLVDGKFLKVRATIPEPGWQQTMVPAFSRELAQRVSQGT